MIPSSTLATRSHASTDSSSVSKMSFQRITIIGSMPCANSCATAARTIWSASFSSRWISTMWAAEVHPVAQLVQRRRDLVRRGDEQLGDRLGLLHRRLDRVAAELVGGLLGEVDDVVERDGQRVDVGGVEVRAAALLGEPAQDRVGDPVALLLAEVDLADLLGGVGDGRERVAQQRGAALGVGAGALEQLEQLGVGCGSAAHPLAP